MAVAMLNIATLATFGEVVSTNTAATVAAPAGAPTNAEPGTLDALFNRDLPDAIGQSKINFQWRPRYEYADTETSKPSQALTMRTVFGLTTARVKGFQGSIEALNLAVLNNRDRYNAGDNATPTTGNNGDKTLVLDPPTTEINQAWLSYNYADWSTGAKGGRQLINLDNQRFVGAVDWRQNPQTFDAIRLDSTIVTNLALNYTYVGRVNRVGGNVPNLAAPLKDFQSDSHVIHADFAACEFARVVGYIYLLDLENSAGNANSAATYGFSVTGKFPATDDLKIDYRGEFAWQTDYADSPLDYSAPYLHLTLGSAIKPVTFGVGYELLGYGDNDGTGPSTAGFRTPLATLHAFNGWADVFLNTPNGGLQDFYVWGQVTLPWQMPLRVMLHKFDAASSGMANYGNELDVSLSRKLGKHWSALLKYAYYDAENAAPGAQAVPSDVHKFWAQVNFSL